ncbi:TPA: copper resistance protein NlpE N-terminal domain-containing protein [Vibrio cholerae]|uniref:copper resistance protein NlpE n=1 Tax=Vibrio cholerae TaxID=666 RepID=UPI0002F2B451|nr:copper resistance protein NlpE N-terminal domain-containing protein [Vibrio cholerae]ELJ8513473.1 copper resistance protein NlpE N-terminal domain-containing protein [Vibrio cholerae]HDZ9310738.1 copper resistance protein NlpE N-terminal domain-containing protein [Vibrio cholerae]HDZ9339711.1 copper resistance protein NlpE N-terminal domain-containing protein [Vibrio cholerae]
MKKSIFALSALTLILVGCDNQQDAKVEVEKVVDVAAAPAEQPAEQSAAQPSTASVDAAHNAQNSLDWSGIYQGTLPCADCGGIETELTLNADGTYALTEKYLDKEGEPFASQGTFVWNEAGNIVTLQTGDQTGRQFMVGENTLSHLDMEGKVIEGELAEFYVLSKQ